MPSGMTPWQPSRIWEKPLRIKRQQHSLADLGRLFRLGGPEIEGYQAMAEIWVQLLSLAKASVVQR